MNLVLGVIGLPLKTVGIVGGLFVISALAPSILAILLKYKKVW
ncbi:hypothetical protein [Natronincola ferrireducens]|uniref:Uncharacterized protein n=1 Tax=Natronincola ferrireducens TaxID=393762 RepID=A0A1G9E8G2_9FIRM|nr:hypothetical protein [Natronincola ferrireducens]SDK72325.1 hypothetical protein SAMN05660472_01870 [Natronincola ferrireducens]